MGLHIGAPPSRSDHGHFELVAPWYDRVFGRREPQLLLERLSVEPGMQVLDIGGGTGRVAERIARLGADVVVVDVSRSMLGRARARGLPAAVALAETLPYRSDSIDRIVVVDAFHHFAHQRWAARELMRVLHPGGRLVVEEPDVRKTAVKAIAIGEKLARMQSRFLSPEQMVRLLEGEGGTIIGVAPDGWSVHLLVTR